MRKIANGMFSTRAGAAFASGSAPAALNVFAPAQNDQERQLARAGPARARAAGESPAADVHRGQSWMVMPASLMIGPDLSISVFTYVPGASGVEPPTKSPSAWGFALRTVSESAVLMSAFILATI